MESSGVQETSSLRARGHRSHPRRRDSSTPTQGYGGTTFPRPHLSPLVESLNEVLL